MSRLGFLWNLLEAFIDAALHRRDRTYTREPVESLAVLDQLAAAWRGDWSDFDGRTLRNQLDSWRVLLTLELAGDDTLPEGIRQFRFSCGLCPNGEGHWEHYCADLCNELAATS